MKLTPKDHAQAAAYDAAKPKQFGNLHERMKYTLAVLSRLRERKQPIDHDLETAIHDLATEIKYSPTATPPYGRRTSQC